MSHSGDHQLLERCQSTAVADATNRALRFGKSLVPCRCLAEPGTLMQAPTAVDWNRTLTEMSTKLTGDAHASAFEPCSQIGAACRPTNAQVGHARLDWWHPESRPDHSRTLCTGRRRCGAGPHKMRTTSGRGFLFNQLVVINVFITRCSRAFQACQKPLNLWF